MRVSEAAIAYTPAEEVWHSLVHGLGALLSIAGLAVLVAAASRRGDAWAIVGCSVYGATLILLYAASTLYHSIPQARAKHVLRLLDHSAIYLLIAGTYTPFTLVNLRGAWGFSLLGVIWGLAILGVASEVTAWRVPRRHLAAGARRHRLHAGGGVLRLAAPALQPRGLARLRARRQRAALLRHPLVRHPGALLSAPPGS
jgi:predicted membrane channel-forming protein YqfA (hemolysin III family)